jgi:predicted XRE-type DNA-binding protein
MNPNDLQFMKDCDAAFAGLNRTHLNKIAFLLGWTFDDLKQEFRLFYWELIQKGKLHGLSGTVQEYFTASVKYMLYGRSEFFNFNQMTVSDEQQQNEGIDEFVSEPSVLDALIERAERFEAETFAQEQQEQIKHLKAALGIKPGWIRRLWEQGLSQTQIAQAGGVSQSHVSRSLNRARKSKKTSRSRSSPTQAVAVEQGVLF